MKQIIIIFFLFFSISLHGQGPQWMVYNTGNSGLPGNNITSITIDSNNVKWIAVYGKGLVRFYNDIMTVYDTANSGLPSNTIFTVKSHYNTIYICGYNGLGKFDQTNWTVYNLNNSGIPSNGSVDIDFDMKENLWLATPQGLGKFDGNTWEVFRDTNSGLPTNFLTNVEVKDTIVWVGTQSYGVASYNGNSWQVFNTQNSGLPNNRTFWDCIRIDENNVKWIGTFGGGLARFNDSSWMVYNPMNSGLQDYYISSLLIENKIKNLIGGNTFGFYIQQEDTSWINYNTSNSPIQSDFIEDIAIDSLGNIWIATAVGLAVYNENGIVNINNTFSSILHDFTLYQNYPNPFNPSTNIKFSVVKKALLTIKVYDIQGRHISTLLNEQKNPGSYEVEFNGEGLPSGVYFYKLEAGEFVQTRRMVLVK